jgi:hypothetical protein
MIPGTVKAFSPPPPEQHRTVPEHSSPSVVFSEFRSPNFPRNGPLSGFTVKPVCPFTATLSFIFFRGAGNGPKKVSFLPVFVPQIAQTPENNTSTLQKQKPGCTFQPGFFPNQTAFLTKHAF